MSVITTIAGIPLFSTVQEALAWARAYRLSGYHTHGWQGQTGYMGGANHAAATQRPIITQPIPQRTTQRPTVTRPIPRRITSLGGGPGGGGGGGY